MNSLTPFHVAIPVHDLAESRKFYGELLGCEEGRSSDQWIDFNLYGHQFVAHMKPKPEQSEELHHNPVDGHEVPSSTLWSCTRMGRVGTLSCPPSSPNEIQFVIEPYIRFKGLPGEQATMFLLDPSGNALEFKAFKDMGQLFAK